MLLHYHCAIPVTHISSALRRVVGEVGLEPTKAYARGFTVPPLCRSGHSPSRSEPRRGFEQKASAQGCEGHNSAERRVLKAEARPGPQFGARLIVASNPERNDARRGRNRHAHGGL